MFDELKAQVLRYEDVIDELQGENDALKGKLDLLTEAAAERGETVVTRGEREKAVVSHTFTIIRVLVDLVKHFLQSSCQAGNVSCGASVSNHSGF